jgi:guanine deaminase
MTIVDLVAAPMNGHAIGLRGHLIDAPVFGTLRSEYDGALIFRDGRIVGRGNFQDLREQFAGDVQWLDCGPVVIFPGLIDCHTHLPQYPAVARGEGELLTWLREIIFPIEREFNVERAREEAPLFFRELARYGTTTAAIFSATYEESCNVAFEAAQASGLRAIIGKMMMDMKSYGELQPQEALEVSVAESERLCRRWHGADNGRLEYAFSPRFAVTCSAAMMREAARLAIRYNAYLQTHLAENRGEIEAVRALFPHASDYTCVYEECGMLGMKTILGHCLHLNRREIDAIAAAGAAVAHCPTSNFFLGSGMFKLEQFIEAGIPVSLGSDVAAGPELNMWQVMRSAIEMQQARRCCEADVRPLRPAEAFYLATQGGANLLGKSNIIGTLEVGKDADLALVDLARIIPYHHNVMTTRLSAEDVVALCIYRGGRMSTAATYVRGRCVYQRKSDPGQ